MKDKDIPTARLLLKQAAYEYYRGACVCLPDDKMIRAIVYKQMDALDTMMGYLELLYLRTKQENMNGTPL